MERGFAPTLAEIKELNESGFVTADGRKILVNIRVVCDMKCLITVRANQSYLIYKGSRPLEGECDLVLFMVRYEFYP